MTEAGAFRRFCKSQRLRTYYMLKKEQGFLQSIAKNPAALVGGSIIALMIICAIFAPWISPHNPLAIDMKHKFEGPSGRYLLGTDELGRDTLARIIYGARITVPIMFGVVVLGAAAGVVLGILAGYCRGTIVDKLLLWFFDIVSTIPGMILVLALVAVFGSSDLALLLVMAFWLVPNYGRIARTETLSVRSSTYIKAAEGLGAQPWQIMLSHMLPNIIPAIIVIAGMDLAVVVMSLAGLSFLGLGMQPPMPSWGGMLSEGYTYVRQTPWLIIWGSVTLLVVMIGCSLFSAGLRASLKPEESLSK